VSTNWQEETEAWVDDGLIEADQRAALQERLESLPPPSSALPLGPLMTVLVAPASFLLLGSAVALMAALLDPPKEAYDLLIGSAAVLMGAAGALGRFVPSVRPLARGLLAASVPMATWTTMSLTFETEPELFAVVALVPAVVAWFVGWAENSRAITASGAVMIVVATCYATFRVEAIGAGAGVAVACLAAMAAASLLRWALPSRDMVLQVGNPALVFLGAVQISLGRGLFVDWLRAMGVQEAWAVERGLLVLAFGTLTLGIGLAGRSGWTLVPGVLCMALATVWIAFSWGSFIGGAIALALVSAGLFVGALALWLLPWFRDASAQAPTTGTT